MAVLFAEIGQLSGDLVAGRVIVATPAGTSAALLVLMLAPFRLGPTSLYAELYAGAACDAQTG